MKTGELQSVRGSGNVFRDLGRESADASRQPKSSRRSIGIL
jgi:hypothetical protein